MATAFSPTNTVTVRPVGVLKNKPAPRRNSRTTNERRPASLACLSCRPRKIRVPDRDERKLRYSKEYIEGLELEVADLRSALEDSRGSEPAASPTRAQERQSAVVDANSLNETQCGSGEVQDSPERLIKRLCGMKGRLSGNTDGQMRYFGPTSSLHLTESVDSISSYCSTLSAKDLDIANGVPEALQHYLLDLYWTYQHSVLPVVHQEAFLSGMKTGEGPYYSRCLLLCILASGARISDQIQIRALTIPTDADDDDDRSGCQSRPLLTQAEEALEKELQNPSVTTVQSLMLLSVVDCCQSDDSKGWMRSGHACRLVFDMGLHQDWTLLSPSQLSAADIEVRQVAFWGCFGLDRLWALYLGRPPFIKLTDVSIVRPDRNAHTWGLRLLAAWVELLDIAGQIGDQLNTSSYSDDQIDFFAAQLDQWLSSLEPSLSFVASQANSAVYHLHMQHHATRILLTRHNAGFGNAAKNPTQRALVLRKACVQHACRIAQLLQEYKIYHGEAYTMLGSALYNTTIAATTLVAQIAEKPKEGSRNELRCLMTCLRTMKEMEGTEIVARNVYKIVRTIMRVCNVRDAAQDVGQVPTVSPTVHQSFVDMTSDLLIGQDQTSIAMWPAIDFEGMGMIDDFSSFSFEQTGFSSEPENGFVSLEQLSQST